MKLIIFGIGGIYRNVKHYFFEEKEEIVALVDNDPKLSGALVDGYTVDHPMNIQCYQYDYIVITSNYAIEMRQQLIKLGICPNKILHYKDYIGSIPVEIPVDKTDTSFPSALILSNELGYHGGPVTCINLARVLGKMGYKITIAVPEAERGFLEEISLRESIKVIVIDNLALLSRENLEWAGEYQYVFANTFVMARCAMKLSEKRKVYLWLHESMDSYMGYEYWYDEIVKGSLNDRLVIGAVSDVARKNFQELYPMEKEIGLLPYGIEDKYEGNSLCMEYEIMTFTVIAPHVSGKGLDVLLDALCFLPEAVKKRCRFLFAGKTFDSEYGKQIRDRIKKNISCEYLGQLSRKEMFKVYAKTDIVIIPSRQDCLPIVATEAMMLKKPCIISDSIGTAGYIKHKCSGLIFQNENSEELAKMICWCTENTEKLREIAENARKIYEDHFTLEKFDNRVADVIKN